MAKTSAQSALQSRITLHLTNKFDNCTGYGIKSLCLLSHVKTLTIDFNSVFEQNVRLFNRIWVDAYKHKGTTMATNEVSSKSFWSTDLNKVEGIFLKKGVKITDLPRVLYDAVPHQGSVLLNKTINIDEVVEKPSYLKRLLKISL